MDLDEMERDLDAHLEEDPPVQPGADPADPDAPVAPAEDEAMVERMLYKARRLSSDREKAERIAAGRRRPVDDWLADRTSGIDRQIRRIEQSCEAFARAWHRDNPRRGKTVKLPSGDLKLTKANGRVVVVDPRTMLTWAETHRPDLIRRVSQPDKERLGDNELLTREPTTQQTIEGELMRTFALVADVPTVDPIPACPECGCAYPELLDPAYITQPPEPGGQEQMRLAPWRWACPQCGTVSLAATKAQTIPGVLYVEPLRDRFKMTLHPNHEGD